MRDSIRTMALVALALLVPLSAGAQGLSDDAPTVIDCDSMPCAEVLPRAVTFQPDPERPIRTKQNPPKCVLPSVTHIYKLFMQPIYHKRPSPICGRTCSA